MTTLIISPTLAEAEREFKIRWLDKSRGDSFCSTFSPLYGNRFDEIIFTAPFVMDDVGWEWFSRGVLTRTTPGGEIRWELR
jgi:hypothetical protein